MQRRQPPKGYFYLDALKPILRHNIDYIITMAETGQFETAKHWSYEVPRPEGERREYFFWIISCDEFLRIAHEQASPVPHYYVSFSGEVGDFTDEQAAEMLAKEVRDQLLQMFPGTLDAFTCVVKEKTDGE